jgi:hypothetical protein
MLVGVNANTDNNSIKNPTGSGDHIEMPEGNGVERTGVDSGPARRLV